LGVRTSDGRDVRLPRSYLESQTERGGRTLDYGYAITGHKAQGMTTGKAFVLGTDELYREWGYVAMSRGSLENRLYIVAPRAREHVEELERELRGKRGGSTQTLGAVRAVADQAKERVAQLKTREDELERAMAGGRGLAADHSQDAVRYAAIGDELDRRGA